MVRRQQAADRAIRPMLRSPGHPKFQRHIEAAFWGEIAKGLLREEAAGGIGVAPAVASRWYRQCGGMRPFDPKPHSGRYLSFSEREEIALLNAQCMGVRESARQVGRDPGTISRELRRNAVTRGGKPDYRASVAQWKSDMAARRPKPSRLVANPQLHAYIQDRLSGGVSTSGGMAIAGPSAGAWTGRNKPHRKDRAWVQAWSPEQIANRIKLDFPDDAFMRIRHGRSARLSTFRVAVH